MLKFDSISAISCGDGGLTALGSPVMFGGMAELQRFVYRRGWWSFEMAQNEVCHPIATADLRIEGENILGAERSMQRDSVQSLQLNVELVDVPVKNYSACFSPVSLHYKVRL